MELADVEIDPAHFVLGRALRDQYHFGLDDSSIADEATAGLHNGLGNRVAEMLAQRAEYRPAIGLELGRLAHVARGKAAAKIDHGEIDAALGATAKDRRR